MLGNLLPVIAAEKSVSQCFMIGELNFSNFINPHTLAEPKSSLLINTCQLISEILSFLIGTNDLKLHFTIVLNNTVGGFLLNFSVFSLLYAQLLHEP